MPHLVYEGGKGTYSVGTLMTSIFYNASLSDGKPRGGGPQPGASYWFQAKDANGKTVQMHWMTCLTGGSSPTFGLTQTLGHPGGVAPAADLSDGAYFDIAPISNTKLTYSDPPAQFVLSVPCDGAGTLIGTRVGTPHLMGVRLSGIRPGSVHVGGRGQYAVSAMIDRDGADSPLNYAGMECVEVDGETCVFLQRFP